MIKLVAFDWNGTILADTIACLEADNATFKKLGLKALTLHELRNFFEVPIVNYYKNAGINTEKFLKNYMENETLFHQVYEKRAAKSRTRANARTVLVWLKKHNISSIIFSNHTATAINKHLDRLAIKKYFENVIANQEIGAVFKNRSKGEKLKNYLRDKGFKPDEMIIVGDTAEEVEIAQELGATSVAITNGYYSTPRLKRAKPNHLIHDLKGIIPIVKSLNSPNA